MAALPNQIRSTAGAVPILNEKGEVSMQKVKVTRYVSGRRPDYAPDESSGESSEEEEGFGEGVRPGEEEEGETGETGEGVRVEVREEDWRNDPRLRRLRERRMMADTGSSRRHIPEPEVVYERGPEPEEEDEEEGTERAEGEGDGEDSEGEEGEGGEVERRVMRHVHHIAPSSSESESEEEDEEGMERRREMMREKARRKAMDNDVLDLQDEEESESEESSEYEEYTDSEDELGPRLKPVFVRKMDRVTIREKEAAEKREEQLESERKRQEELRKRESQRLVADAVAAELAVEQNVSSVDKVVNTDDENEEEEYEAWKVRELQRIKRDREEREKLERDREEIERLRNMTEEERKAELRLNPKVVTNKADKGKYKFLQKYYHRGVFYLDEDETVLKRDVAQPTLEDHFDKTVLPKVMQVKDFGRAGRTKYTHLVDQDTTEFESAWSQATPIALKFMGKRGGSKQVFEKPSLKRRKIE